MVTKGRLVKDDVSQLRFEARNIDEDIAQLDDWLTGLETRLKRLRNRLSALRTSDVEAIENVLSLQ